MLGIGKGALNLHPSLLPRHRGATPVPATILAGDRATGVTLMRMDEGLDTGPIVAQAGTPVEPDETAPDDPAFIVAVRSRRAAPHAGPRPNSTAVPIATRIVNTNVEPSRPSMLKPTRVRPAVRSPSTIRRSGINAAPAVTTP